MRVSRISRRSCHWLAFEASKQASLHPGAGACWIIRGINASPHFS